MLDLKTMKSIERILAYLLILILAFFLFRSCNQKCPPCPIYVGTKIDTVYEKYTDTSGAIKRRPVSETRATRAHERFRRIPVGAGVRPVAGNPGVSVGGSPTTNAPSSPGYDPYFDSAASVIIDDYYTKRTYDVSKPTKYGSVRWKAEVSENMIQNDTLFVVETIPVITNTVTVEQKRRGALFAGPGVIYQHNFLQQLAVGAEAMYLPKSQRISYEVGAYRGLIGSKGSTLYTLSVKPKISFRKR